MHRARVEKRDEFYTLYGDIAREVEHYSSEFRGAFVLCPCDDPDRSEFVRYFVTNFERLCLRGFMAFSFVPNGAGRLMLYDKEHGRVSRCLCGDGDFRNIECIRLIRGADIIVTNPPFSKFKDFMNLLVREGKRFLIVGNINTMASSYLFSYFIDGKVQVGYGYGDGVCFFDSEYEDTSVEGSHRCGLVRVSGICWYTNFKDIGTVPFVQLVKHYTEGVYPKYDNYDAINIDRVADIPYDYSGVMGVPITFLTRYNSNQFEILGSSQRKCHDVGMELRRYNEYWEVDRWGHKTGSLGSKINGNPVLEGKDGVHNYYVNAGGREVRSLYTRIFIRRRVG